MFTRFVTSRGTTTAGQVLLVHVVNLMYPVSIEMLHTVFARHGTVEKIVTFQKDQSVFQAMVQLSQPAEAAQALQLLDSCNLFTGSFFTGAMILRTAPT